MRFFEVAKTHSIAVPVICRDFDGDGGDAECEFRAVAVGYDLSIFKINVPTNITLMMKLGAGIGGGTISADYGMGDKVEKSDNLDFITYGRIGAGFALTLGNWLLIPTAGVGLSLEGLGDFEDEDEDEDSDEKEYVGYDATVDAFVNLTAILMFNNRIGLSFSFEVSTNLCGAGSFTELETYSINFGQLSFTPAIGICCRR